jgi:hypothetical protein
MAIEAVSSLQDDDNSEDPGADGESQISTNDFTELTE